MTYTGKDIIETIGDNADTSYYIRFRDDSEYDIPYSAISDEDFAFLNPADDNVITGAYEDKACDIFAKYVNSGDGVKREKESIYSL